MQFIGFRDNCTISRTVKGAQRDKWDNPVREIIYDGPCLYEEGGSGYSRSIITRAPTIFLPENDTLIMINDFVEITTESGRRIQSVTSIIRDVNMPWRTNIKVTRIELKQAQGE